MCSIVAGLTALSGFMQYQQQQQQADAQAAAYRAQEADYRAQAEAQEQNARVEHRRQESIADAYAQEAVKLRAKRRLAEGKSIANAGAAGIGVGGSLSDLLSSGEEAYQQDQMNLLTNQRNDNYGSRVTERNYKVARANALNQANASARAADNVEEQAKWAGMATILGTAASVFGAGQPVGGSGSATGTSGGISITPSNLGGNTSAMWSNTSKGFSFFPTTRSGRSSFMFNTGW